MAWTEAQQAVIDTRDCSILVAAAAGSGKTAVLVERIIGKITDRENPVDIDRILVVTFTKAAAAEMRGRISDAIQAKLRDNPTDENLMRQSSLVHNAKITTIDSFCGFVVRNYFGEINLDPNFRIADPGEMTLLKEDCMNELFEEKFREREEAFLALVDAYSGAKSASDVKDMVMAIYEKSQSAPWPVEWMQSLAGFYEIEDGDTFLRTGFVQEIVAHTHGLIRDAVKQIEKLKKFALAPGGPQKYAAVLDSDLAMFQKLLEQGDYMSLSRAWSESGFARLPASGPCEESLKNRVKEGRDAYKASVKDAMERYFAKGLEELLAQNRRIRPYAVELVSLAQEYKKLLDGKKRKKHMADFSDVEHFALRILVDEETKKARRVAEEFRRHFEEIMIDEYQDSNQVQEEILCAISGVETGRYNMFMVGDVKQSIYRFRQARPELFMDKYARFSTARGPELRIDLHTNFRSRSQVLDFTNDIFYKIMQADLGAVSYGGEAALNYGATEQYGEREQASPSMNPEILLFDLSDAGRQQMEEDEAGAHALEARMIATRIRDMMENLMVTDKKTRQMRRVKYSDIVILLRTLQGWGNEFMDVLESCKIPAHVETSTGYFAATEVQTVLSVLRVLDNPYQDIPMAAVLKSPMVGLDEEELAELAASDEGVGFARTAMARMETAEEGALHRFHLWYLELRGRRDLPVHELIQEIFARTGYDRYVAALPAGEQRLANLNMLLEKAIAFENTSYKGLFHFVRYIEQLRKYDVDFGEAEVTGESGDVVHIMSIHKSKGLEFPVVFVAGMAKKFNERELNGKMVLHPDLGMGLVEMEANPRIKRQSPVRTEIADRLRRENLGEELRILYVALTRAKEKLILTGTIANREEIYKAVGNAVEGAALDYSVRLKAKCYLDWVLPALASYDRDRYPIRVVTVGELIFREAEEKTREVLDYEQVVSHIAKADEGLMEQVEDAFAYEYPYAGELGRKIKYSVSELKHRAMEVWDAAKQDAQPAEFVTPQYEPEIYVPYFATLGERSEELGQGSAREILTRDSKGDANRGALRGTAVHRVMECLDFVKLAEVDRRDPRAVEQFREEQIAWMLRTNRLSPEEEKSVYVSRIDHFLMNPVAGRMAAAAVRGELYKEKPFVMAHEDALVQGIIDVFWVEEDGIVVLDYKTDNVRRAEELIGHYQTQLDLYATALARAYSRETEQTVTKEKLIYSFKLEEVVTL